ncbi:MAG: ATP-binding protein [Prevotella sp.]|nr:ATP-binding protein [Prevotella sp.]MBO5156808.1 ATP-binding protein [Prevotella sp.]
MTTYITPTICRYETVDKLLKNESSSIFSKQQQPLSIEKLLEEDYLCIVGEPGIGKSRLIEEFIFSIKIKSNLFFCKAYEFDPQKIKKNIDYCIIDALDEVDNSKFRHILKLINEFRQNNKSIKVIFSCRKHYVITYVSHFASCQELYYLEIEKLSKEQVLKVIEKCSSNIQKCVQKSHKLLKLLAIPRYLTFFLDYNKQKSDCGNIGDLFDFIIQRSINNAIENHPCIINKNKSLEIVIQRVLEKIAFVMEIARKDHITKDELYIILDGLKGNMSQIVIANFDLLYFESRILKEKQDNLQFENTELQEYLAAKELCRQDNIESVIYDIAVQKELKHIYVNWFDVIPHISYIADNSETLINLVKLIVSYESNLENETFDSFFRYIDSSLLSTQQQEELFLIVFDNYQNKPVYIHWNSEILNLLKDCYSFNCNALLKLPYEELNKIQLANISCILGRIVEERSISTDVREYWISAANKLIESNIEDRQLAALEFYGALKDNDDLVRISSQYHEFSNSIKEKYCDITGYGKVANDNVVNCWLDSCKSSNPHAINAILNIENPGIIIYAYNNILEEKGCNEFFNPIGALSVFYEPCLKKQFDIIWKNCPTNRLLITKIIAAYLNNKSYYIHDITDTIIKQILLCEEMGEVFIGYFEDKWEIESILRCFNSELIDLELISALEKLLSKSEMEKWQKDSCLIMLINKIRNDANKKDSISEYIARYSETFEQWDKNALEKAKNKHNNSSLDTEYNCLTDNKTDEPSKCEYSFDLCNNIDYLQSKDIEPIVTVITEFFENIDLDDLALNKTGQNSYTLSMALVYIPRFVKFLYESGHNEIIVKNRLLLAKTLPVISCGTNLDTREIRSIYKSIIGEVSNEEKNELIRWWKARKDDFMNLNHENIIACISDYGLDALSYKLEEYVEEYLINQDINHVLAASNALKLISKGFCQWGLEKFKTVFNHLNDKDVESIKMQCNSIMIEKFGDREAIKWRMDYFKDNVVKSIHETGHVRAISPNESEMITPRMFRCFMPLKDNQYLINELMELFDFGLSLCTDQDTKEYAKYLLNQIYSYFINLGKLIYIQNLRYRIENNKNTKGYWLPYYIMNNAENNFLKKDERTIDKSIKLYNKCIEETYLPIRNEDDLRRYFTQIIHEVDSEIQDEGIYSIVRQENLNENFIQRELKNTIINKCCQMGLTNVRIDREVAKQDDKRTDFLVRYGLCAPIMIEIKLLHNKEIQNERKRHEYKEKFVTYSKATKACLSVFWVFDIKRDNSNSEKFTALKKEYEDLEYARILLTDCKCSSGIDTGIAKNKKSRLDKKRAKK